MPKTGAKKKWDWYIETEKLEDILSRQNCRFWSSKIHTKQLFPLERECNFGDKRWENSFFKWECSAVLLVYEELKHRGKAFG